MTPIFFELRVDQGKARLVVLPSRKAVPVFRPFCNPYPVNYVLSFLLYSPLEAGIGRNVSGWHCRRISTLKNIVGPKTRAVLRSTFVKLAEVYL